MSETTTPVPTDVLDRARTVAAAIADGRCTTCGLYYLDPACDHSERGELQAAGALISELAQALDFARTMAPPNAFGAHTMAGLLEGAVEWKALAERRAVIADVVTAHVARIRAADPRNMGGGMGTALRCAVNIDAFRATENTRLKTEVCAFLNALDAVV